MTIKYGRLMYERPRLTGAGRDPRSGYEAGRIYDVDPQAVARLRAMMQSAQGAKEKMVKTIKKTTMDTDDGAGVAAVAPSPIGLQEAHSRYMDGESIKELAPLVGMSWQSLRSSFRQAGLPLRPGKGDSRPQRRREKQQHEANMPPDLAFDALTPDLAYDAMIAKLAMPSCPACGQPTQDGNHCRACVAAGMAAAADTAVPPSPANSAALFTALLADMRALVEGARALEVNIHVKIGF
ncbi:MAG: hypothetical protein IAE79_17910 [Anaerolinea sp.]|nr:hypothetical protein [Anaerolinea sp.]